VSLPVLDRGNRFVGVIPSHGIMTILRHEHLKDTHRLVGVREENEKVSEGVKSSPLRRVRDRLPYLCAHPTP
jgi:magnesium transporter